MSNSDDVLGDMNPPLSERDVDTVQTIELVEHLSEAFGVSQETVLEAFAPVATVLLHLPGAERMEHLEHLASGTVPPAYDEDD